MSDKNLVQYKAFIDKESGSIVCNTLTAQQVICSPATQGAALHIYGDSYYSAELAFMTGTDKLFEVGTTTTNVAPGTGNFFFIWNNQNAAYSIQIITGSPQTINLNGDVNVYGGLGISTNVTVNNTLTASNIVPTAANTGTIGTSSLSYNNSYFNTSNIAHAYIGFIDTLVYMQNGASFYGPLNVLNPVTGDAVFTLTVNNSNQLNFESAGQTAPLTIDAGSNTLNLPSDLIVSGSISVNSITNPSGTSGTINITGSVNISNTLTATTINPSPSSYSYAGTSGFAYVVQPFTGSGYKKVLIIFSSYNPGAALETFDFPVSFSGQYQVTSNINNLSYTLTSSAIEITNFDTSTTYKGGMTIEGW